MRGRNSENTLIKKVLGWAPSTPLKKGLGITYNWIKQELKKVREAGDKRDYTKSIIVKQEDSVESLRDFEG